ncbi:MAG: transposase [Rhodospirillales bacterium]|nr:transposase [Acetobacter sp.]
MLCGGLLAPANCVITVALRVLGLSDDAHFQNYHRVLNRARWSAHHAAGILLRLLVRVFVPAGPVVLGLDDTVERHRGAKIAGRSMCHDAVRLSWGCFQKTSGLRWIGLHLITRIPWAKRTWALPFLTALAPSYNYPACVRARGLIVQAQRWLPVREIIILGEGGYAVIYLLAWCQRLAKPVTVISRLRMDGALYTPAPPRRPGQRGRCQVKGQRLPTPSQYLASRRTKSI